VGVDRLLNAVAANRLRQTGQPALLVDVGTAITIDMISSEGSFLGGAILPGIAMAARAMHEFTDLLPLVPLDELTTAPRPLGTSTETAMRSGLFWGAVGAVQRLTDELDPDGQGQVFLTGGAGDSVADLLKRKTVCLPHLTLAGIAITVAAMQTDTDGDEPA
jgi:type III pantothenate kinase